MLFLAVLPAASQDASPVPEKIRPLLIQRPGLQNYLVGASSKNKTSYYVVLELDRAENSQALIVVDPQGKAKLVDRLPIIFPLNKYIQEEDVIKDLANQYVKFLINSDIDGKEGIQKALNHNPLVFTPSAPDLIEAYQKAGLKLHLKDSPDEEKQKTDEPEQQ